MAQVVTTANAVVSASGSTSLSDLQSEYTNARNDSTPGGATLREVEKRNFGTSDSDLKAYAEAGGAAAAVAGCAAIGAGIAAPLCGYIGGKIGGAIYSGVKAIVGLFSNDEDVKRELERRRKNNEASRVKMNIDFMSTNMNDALGAAENSLIVLHSQLFPDALPLTSQEVRTLLKSAGLNLTTDWIGDRQTCVSGNAVANGLEFPFLPRVIITQNQKFLTRLSSKCNSVEYTKAIDAIPSDALIARYPEAHKAVVEWITQLSEASKTVTGALINLSSNKELQALLAQSKELRASNDQLANSKEMLLAKLTRLKQYEDYYLKLKRENALKRVAAEKQKSDELLAAMVSTQTKERRVLYLAGAVLGVSTLVAVWLLRRKR